MISSIPTVSFSSVNLSLPLPVIRKRQNITAAAAAPEIQDELDPTVPPRPIKRSTGSILRAKRLSAVNTISKPFVARRTKSESPATTESSHAQSISKEQEQESPAPTNKLSQALRTKYQHATTRPVMLVKRSAQSIFRSKKPKGGDLTHPHPELVELHVYEEEKPETEGSDESETSSLLSESVPTSTSSAPSVVEEPIEPVEVVRAASVKSPVVVAVVVEEESVVLARSFYERYRWLVMILMVTIIGVSSEFFLRRH